jgi:hypothetical protein
MSTTTVGIIERKLTDGSEVYDVVVGGWGVLPAVTHKDAVSLADKLSAAIEAHTNEIVTRDF